MSLNKVMLLGKIGKDVELKSTNSGNAIATFSIATTESYLDKEKKKVQQTTWHNVVFYGKKAEVIKSYFHKGSQIMIEGKISNRSYEKDGVTRYISEVIGDEFHFIDKKETSPTTNTKSVKDFTTEEIPF